MANGIRTGDPRGFNEGRREGSRVQQTPEEGRGTYRPKRCRNNNKDEDNRPKALNNKNHQALSQKFRQLITILFCCTYSNSFSYCYLTHHHHHHHVVPQARISLTLFLHFSLSFIASGRSSGLHSVTSHTCWMYVRAGHPAFTRPYVGVHRSTSLMSSSLLLQQWPAWLVRLAWIVFVMGGRWPYSWCLVGCCLQDLFNIARNILV